MAYADGERTGGDVQAESVGFESFKPGFYQQLKQVNRVGQVLNFGSWRVTARCPMLQKVTWAGSDIRTWLNGDCIVNGGQNAVLLLVV